MGKRGRKRKVSEEGVNEIYSEITLSAKSTKANSSTSS